MTLMDLYMQRLQAPVSAEATQGKSQDKTASGNDFGGYLSKAEAGNKNTFEATESTQAKNGKTNYGDAKKTDYSKKDSPASQATKADETVKDKPDQSTATQTTNTGTAQNGKTEEAKSDSYTEEEFQKATKELLKKLSEALNMPVEQIQSMLVSLNITPLELADPVKLNEFVQKLAGVDSAAALLTVDNAPELFRGINSALAEFEDIAKAYLQNVEIEEIGKPQFIDATPVKPQPMITVSAQEKPVQVQATQVSQVPVQAAQDQQVKVANNPVEVTAEAEVEPEGIVVSVAESQTTGQNSAQTETNTDGPGAGIADPNIVVTAEAENNTLSGVEINPMNFSSVVNVNRAEIRNEAVRNINTQDIIEQIVQKIKVDIRPEASEIKILLKPEQLGEVTLKITSQNGIVTAQFVAENQRVKEIIETGFNQLRDSLQQQGINIEQLSVSVGQDNPEQRMGQFLNEQKKSSGRITQIMEGIELEEEIEQPVLNSYVYDNELYDANMDYKV